MKAFVVLFTMAWVAILLCSFTEAASLTNEQRRIVNGMSNAQHSAMIQKEKAFRMSQDIKFGRTTGSSTAQREKKMRQLEGKQVYGTNGQLLPKRRIMDVPINKGSKVTMKEWVQVDKSGRPKVR